MNETLQKIKKLVENPIKQQGIRGLIKLQNQVSQSMKYKCRIACLHLMQITHDWDNIYKFITEWKMVKVFGKQLINRMKKRVEQQQLNYQLDNEDQILKQLNRLNEKNWRQYSPKKKFPDYYSQFPQMKVKLQNKEDKTKLQNKQEKNKVLQNPEKLPNIQRNSIFSKISQLQKTENVPIFSKGVFSKQLLRNQETVTNKQKNDKNQQITKISREQKANENSKKSIITNKQLTPSKQVPKKVISFKYGQRQKRQEDKPKQESKDQFSFSAVKSKQIQGNSQKKWVKQNDLDNSFLNFSNESKKQKGQEAMLQSNTKNNILDIMKEQQQFHKSLGNTKYMQSKPLFTEQELGLIQLQIPPKNYIKYIIESQGCSALNLLKKLFAV